MMPTPSGGPRANHLRVPVDVEAQDELNHLEADVEADGDDLARTGDCGFGGVPPVLHQGVVGTFSEFSSGFIWTVQWDTFNVQPHPNNLTNKRRQHQQRTAANRLRPYTR